MSNPLLLHPMPSIARGGLEMFVASLMLLQAFSAGAARRGAMTRYALRKMRESCPALYRRNL
jgi:hypothetical protein